MDLHHISLSYLLRYKSICSELQLAREPAVFCFYIRIAYLLEDDALLQENLHNLLTRDAQAATFLEVSHFYFNICRFFLERRMHAENKAVLDLIEACAAELPVCCLSYRQLTYRAAYAEHFSSADD